jgi:membrane protease YdiL (CAAX protease family)
MEQFTLAEGFSFSTGFVPVLLLLLMAATFEELGWRGYAFDSLQSKLGNFKATLLFSILWSLWHLPLIFVVDSYQYEIFRQNPWFGINFLASIVPLGFIISWMCMKNRKSVLSAILFHFIVNMSQEMFAITQETKCIQSFVLLILSALIVYYDRDLFFQKNPAPTV